MTKVYKMTSTNIPERSDSEIATELLEERRALDTKITKLFAFNVSEKFKSLSKEMQTAMCDQESSMREYSNALKRRIDLLVKM